MKLKLIDLWLLTETYELKPIKGYRLYLKKDSSFSPVYHYIYYDELLECFRMYDVLDDMIFDNLEFALKEVGNIKQNRIKSLKESLEYYRKRLEEEFNIKM